MRVNLAHVEWTPQGTRGDGTLTFTFAGGEEIPDPPFATERYSFVRTSATEVTVTMPASRRNTEVTAPTGVWTRIENGVKVHTQYTWRDGAWRDPVPVDSDGVGSQPRMLR